MGYEHQHSEDKHESFDVIIELEDDVDGEEEKNQTQESHLHPIWNESVLSHNPSEWQQGREVRGPTKSKSIRAYTITAAIS